MANTFFFLLVISVYHMIQLSVAIHEQNGELLGLS